MDVVRAAWVSVAKAGPDGLLPFLDPAIEWNVRGDLPDAGCYRGHAGFRKLLARFDEAFEEQGYEPLAFIEAGDRVVVPLRWWGRGRTSGATIVERDETWVFGVRDAAITSVDEFATKAEALEAVGLGE